MALSTVRPKTYSRRLYAAKMWREDLEQMVSLLLTQGKNESVGIRVEARGATYRLDTFADFDELKKRGVAKIKRITVSFEVGKVTVILGDRNDLTAEDPDFNLRARLGMVEQFVRSKGRIKLHQWVRVSRARMAVLWVAWLALMVVVLSDLDKYFGSGDIGGQSSSGNYDSGSYVSMPNWATWLIAAAFWVVYFGLQPGQSRLFTSTKTEAPPFLARNRDEIIIATISAFAGGIIGYFVNQITPL